jgi:hypothetical protein
MHYHFATGPCLPIVSSMGRFTIRLFKNISPEKRLLFAVYMFWFTLIGGVYSTIWVAETSYEKILMGISWGAMVLTAYDVIVTTDVRDEQD